MEGIIWLFLALIVALVALGAVVAVVRGRQPRAKTDHCPSCRTPMSLRRVSVFESPTLRVQWVCPHCGNRIKKGRSVGTAI
jgi:ribosomal protein L37AE/L43A